MSVFRKGMETGIGTSDDHTVSRGGGLIVTKEQEALAVSLNMGYFYNDYGSAQDALLKTR